MKYNIIILSVLALTLYSCNDVSYDESNVGSMGGNIVISGITSSPVDTKAAATGAELVGCVEDQGLSLKVYDREESCEGSETKAVANEITRSTLTQFNMYGYLGSEIKLKPAASEADKSDLNFIKNASVVKNGDYWNFASGTYKWRYGVNHHFWAYYPTSLGLKVDAADTSKASFSSYTNNGTQDVLVAYTKQRFGKIEESSDKRDSVLHLQFHHALSEICVTSCPLYVTEVDEFVSDRVSIGDIKILNAYSTGDCAINGDNITWSNLKNTSASYDLLNDNKPQFMIPQDKSNMRVFIETTDTRRQLTIPHIFSGTDAFGSGSWSPGHRHNYEIVLDIKVPYLKAGATGIDANFTGKGFQTCAVVEDLPGKYISQITLTWSGLADTNGNGTYCLMGIVEDGHTPTTLNTGDCNNTTTLKNAGVGFSYDSFHSKVILGTATGNPSSVGYNNVVCSCTIDIPEGMNAFDIYALYLGGTNGNGQVYWHMSNMKVEVTGWR